MAEAMQLGVPIESFKQEEQLSLVMMVNLLFSLFLVMKLCALIKLIDYSQIRKRLCIFQKKEEKLQLKEIILIELLTIKSLYIKVF